MKRKDELSLEEEIFVQGLAIGKTQRQAYLNAFPNRRSWSSSTVDSKASKLANSGKVKARLKEIRQDTINDLGVTRNKVIQQVKNVAFCNFDVDKMRAADKIRALELLANLMGYLDKD